MESDQKVVMAEQHDTTGNNAPSSTHHSLQIIRLRYQKIIKKGPACR